MRSRLLTVLGALALAVAGSVLAAGSATADPAHCYNWNTHPDRYTAGQIAFTNGTYIRRGPWMDCDGLGLGYPSHGIDVNCLVNNGGYLWIYVRDTTTGIAGWARRDTLAFYGSAPVPGCY
jgi:hypothetical protein